MQIIEKNERLPLSFMFDAKPNTEERLAVSRN